MQTKEEIAIKKKQYREDNKEEIAIKARQHYLDNKEGILAYQKKYNTTNREERAAKAKKYYLNTKEERLAYKKQYYQANKEEILVKHRQYHRDNRGEILAQSKAQRAERSRMIFEYKGGGCSHCKLREPDHLELYDYHHTDPSTKLHGIATILLGPLERLMSEVDKCLLLCAHCHRKEHTRLYKEKLNE